MKKGLELIVAGALGLASLVGCDNSRFDKYDSTRLRAAGISIPEAERYDKRFNAHEIERLFSGKVSPETAALYDGEFSSTDIVVFNEEKVSHETARQYLPRFDGENARVLARGRIIPAVAKEYDSRFSGCDIVRFCNIGVVSDGTPEGAPIYVVAKVANAYDTKFDAAEIIDLHKAKISPEKANQYKKLIPHFAPNQIKLLSEADISADVSAAYDKDLRHGNSDQCGGIIMLFKAGIMPVEANKYAALNNKYDARISAEDIIFFKKNDISFADVEKQAKAHQVAERLKR